MIPWEDAGSTGPLFSVLSTSFDTVPKVLPSDDRCLITDGVILVGLDQTFQYPALTISVPRILLPLKSLLRGFIFYDVLI